MNRDNIIGLILIFVILIGFSIFNTPSEEERERIQQQRDSIATAQQEEQDRIREARLAEEEQKQQEALAQIPQNESVAPEQHDSLVQAALRDQMGLFASAATGEDEFITLENEKLLIRISKKGGSIQYVELKDYKTWDHKPLVLFDSENHDFSIQFYSANRLISTKNLYFEPVFKTAHQGSQASVAGADSLILAMKVYPDNHSESNPSFLEFEYILRGDDFMVDFNLNTRGLQDVIASNTTLLNLDWQTNLSRLEKSRKNEMNLTTVYYKFFNDEVDNLTETRDDSEDLKTSIKWISFKQQFFSSALIAANSFNSAQVSTQSFEEEQDSLLKKMNATIDIPYNSRENNDFPMHFYFGPNHYNTLKEYDMELEQLIPLGWTLFRWINRFFVIPVFNYLDSFDLNYGIIILILTLLLKLILFPIAYKTYLSSARMRVLKPDIEELNQKFPKKEDAMKKQQAQMALYKKAGVNPLSGCVPMLLQFPILIAMFRFFPASFELRQEPFLWADDLSSYDSILTLPFTIPWYGDHVSLFTLLMTVSTIIYTHMNSQMMNTGTQLPGMKTMLYFMPVMLLFVFNSFASGLSYYYFLTNMITFAQMYAFRFMIDEDKIRKKIEENKKKPVKKSSWQKRLEEMAKQQQQQKKRK